MHKEVFLQESWSQGLDQELQHLQVLLWNGIHISSSTRINLTLLLKFEFQESQKDTLQYPTFVADEVAAQYRQEVDGQFRRIYVSRDVNSLWDLIYKDVRTAS